MNLSLVGLPVLVLFVVGAIGFSLLALFGGRAAATSGRSRAVTLTIRTTALILSQVMVVALAADLVNRHYMFFVSWGDLFGTAKVTGVAQQSGSTSPLVVKNSHPQSPGNIRGTGRGPQSNSPWPKISHVYPLSPTGWGRVDMVLTGQQSGITGQLEVLLPPHWTPTPARAYPVIEVLPGFPGTFTTMTGAFGVRAMIENAVDQHKLHDAIIVSVTDHGARDSECINSQLGQWATWLAHDIPNWLAAHVGATTDPAARVTLGFSMGGWCANMLTVKYPNVFGGSISMGGYTAPAFQSPNPLPRTPQMMATYDIAHILFTNPPPVRMWMQTDALDQVSYPATAHFLAHKVMSPAAVTVYLTTGVGHNFRVIQYFMPPALVWLTHAMPAFSPLAP